TGGTLVHQPTSGRPAIEGWVLPAYPRREATVGVRIDQVDAAGHWVPAASFTVPNPVPGSYSTCTAQEWPATQQLAHVAFTPTDFWTGAGGWRSAQGPRPARGEDPWTHAFFHATRRGHPAPGWQPEQLLEVSDATGNDPKFNGVGYGVGDPSNAGFAAQILPCEVWKLRVRFAHDAQGDYAGDQTYSLRGVPVPKPGAAAPFPAAFTLQGFALRFAGITWRRDVIGQRPAIELQTQGPTVDHRLTLRATDERGRRVSEST